MRGILFLLLFSLRTAFALEWGIDAHDNLTEPITRFQVFSERCSGSTYLQRLLLDNLTANGQKLPLTRHFGHKHFPRWFELPQSAYFSQDQKYTFDSNANTLFIILFRDPYDWLRSFNLNPHHAVKGLHKLPFSTFIRTRWRVNQIEGRMVQEKKENPFIEIDPLTGRPFRNVIQMRTQKIKTMLEIAERVQNVYLINYETLRDFPEEVLDEIANLFGLSRKEVYTPVVYHKGNPSHGKYRPKKYVSISKRDLAWINSELDHEMERLIGYEIATCTKEVDTR